MDKIIINTHEKVSIIDLQDINYLEAKGAYTIFAIKNGRKAKASKNLNHYSNLIKNDSLVKIERGLMLNINNLSEILKESNQSVIVFKDNTELVLSKPLSLRLLNIIEEHFI